MGTDVVTTGWKTARESGASSGDPRPRRGERQKDRPTGMSQRRRDRFSGRGTRTALTHMRWAPAGLGQAPADHLFSQ